MTMATTMLPSASAHADSSLDPETVNVDRLRQLRNSVIGSRTKKSEVVAQGKVPGLVRLLSTPLQREDGAEIKSLAATIVGSLAHDAPPPTLLSLCRAQASQSIIDALSQLASSIPATEDAKRGRPGSADPTSNREMLLSTDDLKLVESYLRALRSLIVALADEVSPGNRWQRLPGVGYRYNQAITQRNLADRSSGSASILGKSSREVIGWHIADAGFSQTGTGLQGGKGRSAKGKQGMEGDADGDSKMSSASSSDLRRDAAIGRKQQQQQQHSLDMGGEESGAEAAPQTFDSPYAELIWLARRAIATAFTSHNLPLWLGALFIARLPISVKVHAATTKSRGGSRPGTRPASPRRHGTSTPGSRPGSSKGTESAPLTGSPAHSNLVKVTVITEMVSGILSSCLCIAATDADAAEALSSSNPPQDSTPALILAQRRKAVLDFAAEQSPFWIGRSGAQGRVTEGGLGDEGRGREGSGSATQASFVKRGKSVEHHYRDSAMEEDDDNNKAPSHLVDAHRGSLDVLLEATECGYAKTQEAALWALTDLARENTETSAKLFNCLTPSGLIPTSMLLNLRKDPSASIRLAAFCCLAHIIKVHPFTPKTNDCVLAILVELLDYPSEVQATAAFALARLVTDDMELQGLACDQYDCIAKLASLLDKSKNAAAALAPDSPLEAQQKAALVDEQLIRLREATLVALAALSFQRDDIRRRIVDHTTPSLLPIIVSSLTASHLGVRIAACRLVRALSRSVSILRTSLVDAGVASKLLDIIKSESVDEGIEIKSEATASLCNLVVKFSPMKQFLLESGGIVDLLALCSSQDAGLRLNALWAIKNILYCADTETKRAIVQGFNWNLLKGMCRDVEVGALAIQEQALNIVRNLASSNPTDIDLTIQGMGGADELFTLIEDVVWQRRSDAALEQVAYILVNLATGREELRRMLLARPNLLDATVFFLNHPKVEIRVAGVWIASNLTQPTRPASSSLNPIGSATNHAASSGGGGSAPNPTGVGATPSGNSSNNVSSPLLPSLDVCSEAIVRLKSFGFDTRLRTLIEDPERDVSDRALSLLTRFE